MTTLSKVIEDEQMKNILAEFTRLQDQCYLENAGASQYPQRLPIRVNQDLISNVYMNPHTDKYTRDCIEQMRSTVLRFFNTDSSNYTVIFTSGTTQALKLVVESFQFANDPNELLNCGSFVYLRDNHTSVLGLREIAADKNADIIHICHDDFLNSLKPTEGSPIPSKKYNYKNEGNTLLVYPGQSNFNGFKYPIDCVQNIKNGCLNSYIKKHLCKVDCNWYVLLDAASYLSTNKLDLSQTQPDFVCLSFYKIFGYPTGLGALLVKNSSADVLTQKRYFGGGTVDIVLSSEDYHLKRKALHERFEDGTQAFLSIIALKHCFDILNELIPRVVSDDIMDTIAYHTFYLAKDLYHQLDQLKHRNGKKAVVFYMDSDFTDINVQGAIVTFNLYREDESPIGYAEFQHLADLFNISVRTGCFCNSGSCQRHLNATNKEMKDMYKAGHKCGDEIDLVNGRPTGAIRVSFGYYNTFNDVDKLMSMICQCFVKTKVMKPVRMIKHFPHIESKQNKCNEESMRLLSDDDDTPYCKKVEFSPYRSEITLKEIAIFPIKSCGAFKVSSSWKIGSKGFEYDREWMIVKDNGVCLTQKQNTRMCMIRPQIDLKQKVLILNCKGMAQLSIPLDQANGKQKSAMFCQSKVCSDVIYGYDCGDQAADWISNALDISFLRLIRQSNDNGRVQKKKGDGDQKQLSFSNQAQFLLINQATVRWLSDKIEDTTFQDNLGDLTDRFRGNLVIDMDQELAERDWHRVIVGKHEFRVEGQCARCQMVCIDQKSGDKTVEPLRTISEQFGGKLRFGIYLSYIGPVDGSRDHNLKLESPIKPIINDDDISRFKDWFYMYFIKNVSCPSILDGEHKKRKKKCLDFRS